MSTYGWLHLSGVGNSGIISSTVPGGPNKAVQYNDNGAFDGDASFLFDEATNTVQVNGTVDTTNLYVNTLYDNVNSRGTAGQLLTSDGTNCLWQTPSFPSPTPYGLSYKSIAPQTIAPIGFTNVNWTAGSAYYNNGFTTSGAQDVWSYTGPSRNFILDYTVTCHNTSGGDSYLSFEIFILSASQSPRYTVTIPNNHYVTVSGRARVALGGNSVRVEVTNSSPRACDLEDRGLILYLVD